MRTPQPPAAPDEPIPARVGGPIIRLYLRYPPAPARPGETAVRLFVAVALAWLPLCVLSIVSRSVAPVAFFYDFEVHLKLLVALPVLVLADFVAQPRFASVVRQLVDRGLVADSDRPRLEAAVAAMARARDSVVLEVAVVAVVYSLGHWIWRDQLTLGTSTWFATSGPGGVVATLPGLWYEFVSAPIFRFVLFLWYARLLIWFRVLWSVSRLPLRLTASHPDRAGGLGFVGNSVYAFAPFLFAQGVLLSGLLANRIFYEGSRLVGLKLEIAGLASMVLILVVAPLTVFAPQLARTKRLGLCEFGTLASRFVQEFDEKWMRDELPPRDELLGLPDIQSLCNLGGSYDMVRAMRPLPCSWQTITRLALLVLIPLAPLTLTALPLEEILDRALRMLF
jgi:hypothetical protein